MIRGRPRSLRLLDAHTFFGLEATDDERTWRLPVTRGLCSGFGALFGGVALGAAVDVLERVTGRPVVWATAQYLQFAWPGSVVELRVDEVVRGHASSQGRVLARVDDEEIFTVVAATGKRSSPYDGTWTVRPDVPDPAGSPGRELPAHQEGTIGERLEMRLADARLFEDLDGTPGDGRSALWVRLPDGLPVSGASLAILGDYVAFGIGQALGRPTRSNSIDNTLRMIEIRPSEWVLVDIRIQAVMAGFGHGLVHLWAEDGTLLATASQSTITREWVEPQITGPPESGTEGEGAPAR